MKRSIDDVNGSVVEENNNDLKKPMLQKNKKRRIYPQIGDTSMEEDDHFNAENLIEKLQQFKSEEDFLLQYISKKRETFSISTSCILKEISYRLLQSKIVQDKHRDIQSKFFQREDQREKYERLNDQLGRGWGILLDQYLWKIIENNCLYHRYYPDGHEKYFLLNENKINDRCNGDETYKKMTEDHEKGMYYLIKLAFDYFCTELRETLLKSSSDNSCITKEWNDKLGKDWDLVDPNSTESLTLFYEKNEEKINKKYKYDNYYEKLTEDYEKAFYHFSKNVMKDFFAHVQRLKEGIHAFDVDRRKLTELVNLDFKETSPGSFLARLVSSAKLDRDLMEVAFYKLKESKKEKLAQKTYASEIIFITDYKCSYFKEKVGKYEFMDENLKCILKSGNKEINPTELKTILQLYFRGEEISDKNKTILEKLKSYIELIFGIEVIRNSSALLTCAMFFDLLHRKKYTMQDLSVKLPMAMDGAVEASRVFNDKMNRWNYDYQKDKRLRGSCYSDVAKLTKRDQTILYDWLEQNIIVEIEKRKLNGILSTFNQDDVMQKLQDMQENNDGLHFLDLTNCDPNAPMNHEKTLIPFRLPYYSGKLRLEWEKNLKRYNIKICEINNEVSAKVFYNLILEWYNIELQELNKDETIEFDFSLYHKEI